MQQNLEKFGFLYSPTSEFLQSVKSRQVRGMVLLWCPVYLLQLGEFVHFLSLTNKLHYYTLLSSDWLKGYSKFSKLAPVTSSSCKLHNNHVKDTQGHG